MAIVWREQMSIGVKPIDDDHRDLISIINDFENVAAGALDEPKLKAIAKRLYDYARKHFEREERLQVASRYQFHDAHKREHEMLLKQLEDFIRAHFIDKTTPVNQESGERMSAFLKEWLVNHIIKSDLRMRGQIASPPGFK